MTDKDVNIFLNNLCDDLDHVVFAHNAFQELFSGFNGSVEFNPDNLYFLMELVNSRLKVHIEKVRQYSDTIENRD